MKSKVKNNRTRSHILATSTSRSHTNPLGPSAEERMTAGKALRERVPRTSHAKWSPAPNRADPIALLKSSNSGRLTELLPIRYGRMGQSPFAFFRGAAGLMAADLAGTPITKIRVEACGDCHLLNL